MKWKKWQDLHEDLNHCEWFSRVGMQVSPDSGGSVQWVTNWAEAATWATAEISWWCANEASNKLRLVLNDHHNKEYQKWNDHINSFSLSRDSLISGPVTSALPIEFRTNDMLDWVRSHLTRAFLECVYSELADVRLARIQVAWYLEGHFPCGWFVSEETAFPSQAVTILF